jgi:hypothetical protein
MLDHMILSVSDIKRSLAFYEAAVNRKSAVERPLFDEWGAQEWLDRPGDSGHMLVEPLEHRFRTTLKLQATIPAGGRTLDPLQMQMPSPVGRGCESAQPLRASRSRSPPRHPRNATRGSPRPCARRYSPRSPFRPPPRRQTEVPTRHRLLNGSRCMPSHCGPSSPRHPTSCPGQSDSCSATG